MSSPQSGCAADEPSSSDHACFVVRLARLPARPTSAISVPVPEAARYAGDCRPAASALRYAHEFMGVPDAHEWAQGYICWRSHACRSFAPLTAFERPSPHRGSCSDENARRAAPASRGKQL